MASNLEMPTYEYKCKECDSRITESVHVDERDSVFCKECGARLRRIISAPALSFVGVGFTRGFVRGG